MNDCPASNPAPTSRREFIRTTAGLALGAAIVSSEALNAATPDSPDATAGFAIATFHCIGLYWSPPGGAAEKSVLVRHRKQGATAWREGLPMRYNPIEGTEEDLADYRGSIVHLAPGSAYEIELQLEGTSTKRQLTSRTWSETFPVGETVRPGASTRPLVIAESGAPNAYRVYDGRGATIDVKHQHDACITIDASYVIVRGFTLKGAGNPANTAKAAIGSIVINGGHHIVIEDCDISDWGRLNPKTGYGFNIDSGIYSRSPTLRQLVVQRCKIHHPAQDSNNWYEPKNPTHPQGPQCISLFNTAGNHVIRYNECWSDLEHMYNDAIGGGENASFRGSPGPDSDVYGNVVSHCWDDGLEIEGGNRNTRIWNNYITQCMMMIGNAATSIGPLYVWRNIGARSQWQPESHGGNFVKMGFAADVKWMTGHMYFFHNTMFSREPWLSVGGLGGSRVVRHCVARNNILHVRLERNNCLSGNPLNLDNSYDFDLYNGQIPTGCETHGVRGEAVYVSDAGFDPATQTGQFQLAPDSPGAAAGERVPNFSDAFSGKAPDIGAHQRGTPRLRFGVQAREAPAE